MTRDGRSKFWDLQAALELEALKSGKSKQIGQMTIDFSVWRLLTDDDDEKSLARINAASRLDLARYF
jgi:hypothetical protein